MPRHLLKYIMSFT